MRRSGWTWAAKGRKRSRFRSLREVQGVVHGRGVASRRLTSSEVADQLEKGGVSQYLRVQCGMGA